MVLAGFESQFSQEETVNSQREKYLQKIEQVTNGLLELLALGLDATKAKDLEQAADNGYAAGYASAAVVLILRLRDEVLSEK